jgi:hypothetical protein
MRDHWIRQMETALALATLAITTLLTGAGLYFAHALRRRMRQEVSERRLDAYLSLWPVLRIAASTRSEGEWAGGPLTERERKDLFDATTDWYYGRGETKPHGPFLTARARRVYFKAKRNLMCPVDEIEPESNREYVRRSPEGEEAARGTLSIRHFAIVRWVMRFDIQLHTDPYLQTLNDLDLDFLDSCGIDWRDEPLSQWARVER